MARPMTPRAQLIAQRIRNGDTYAAIGTDLGISKQRVQQIASRHDVKPLQARSKPLTADARQVAELLESEPRLSYKEVAERTESNASQVKKIAKRAGLDWIRQPIYRRGLHPWDYDVDPDTGCWNWRYGKDIYGHGRLHGGASGAEYAHRFAYRQYLGPIPAGESVIHTCGNLACINPEHLQAAPLGRSIVTARRRSLGRNPN